MSDSGFREIQLSGKHVVFLFMAGVVAAVAIFLLGVSVGRGVTKPGAVAPVAPAPVEAAAGGGQAAETPPKTTPEQGELKYQATLQDKGNAKEPAAAPATPPAAPAKPAAAPAPSPQASAKPGAATTAVQPKADAVWYVLVNSFSSRENATRQVDALKAKGIAARINTRAGSGARYQVRVGPMGRADADAMVDRLRKEGMKPSVTR
jgi:cell division protein FtsN